MQEATGLSLKVKFSYLDAELGAIVAVKAGGQPDRPVPLAELGSSLFGGRLMLQTDKASPYLIAAIGSGNALVQSGGYYYSGGSALASRLGGGVDYKTSDMFSIRVEVTKLQIHSGGVWIGKTNISTGVVFTLMQ